MILHAKVESTVLDNGFFNEKSLYAGNSQMCRKYYGYMEFVSEPASWLLLTTGAKTC